MPVDMSWKDLYALEIEQMRREGYLVGKMSMESFDDEANWKSAYGELMRLKSLGISRDFPYREPNGFDDIMRLANPEPVLEIPGEAEYQDRVRGAWYGRCAAVVLGKPLEMGMNQQEVREYLESVEAYPLSDWVPEYSAKLDMHLRKDCIPSTRGNVKYVQSDDDINYTISSLLLAEAAGENFTLSDAAECFLTNTAYYWVWTADRCLYWNLVNMDPIVNKEEYLSTIGDRFNPYRESMCPHLKSDFWGYITPSQPRRGARMIHRLGSLSGTKNGLYGGMFMQGCISAALSVRPSIETILEAGLANIPNTSRLYEAITDVIRWYGDMLDWEKVCEKIYQKYGNWYFAGAINNLCFVTLALLAGNLDFEKSICIAVMCGTDTDCNSANTGSVVGAAIGYESLPSKWIAPLHDDVRSAVANFGCGSISDLVQRTIAVGNRLKKM